MNDQKINLLKIGFGKRVRIKILTSMQNFYFQDYHQIFRKSIKGFYTCTIGSGKCFCCEEHIKKRNAVLVKVYCYEKRSVFFMLLNHFNVQEMKKSIIKNHDFMLRNDFIVGRVEENKGGEFYFFSTKNNSMNDFHRDIIKNDTSISLNRAYDLISINLKDLKIAFHQDFVKYHKEEEKSKEDNDFKDISESRNEMLGLRTLNKEDFGFEERKELSIHKNDTSQVEKQFELIDDLQKKIKGLKRIQT